MFILCVFNLTSLEINLVLFVINFKFVYQYSIQKGFLYEKMKMKCGNLNNNEKYMVSIFLYCTTSSESYGAV